MGIDPCKNIGAFMFVGTDLRDLEFVQTVL